ncbi:MAG: dihydropteroate synthase [Gemmatimonadota bacterium]
MRHDDAPTHDHTPPAAPARRWRLRGAVLDLQRPQVMAICNVTPDSFSDGGEHYSVALACEFAQSAMHAGATILDVGGESTRPGATPVPVDTELARVLPVIEAVRDRFPTLLVTIDTVKAAVARAALAAGAHAVNDVSGGRLDPAMFDVVAESGAGMVVMHSRGDVRDMASLVHTHYAGDVVTIVAGELARQVELARRAGIADDALVLDPGIGFAKTTAQSVALLRAIPRITAIGFPVLVGASRKRVIGELTGVREPSMRAVGSAVAHAWAAAHGARIIRTHDVAATCDALAVVMALAGHDEPS